MTEAELINRIQAETGYSKVGIEKVYKSMKNHIKSALSFNDNVKLQGIGTLKTIIRKSRRCHNPRVGKIVVQPSKKAVKFQISKRFSKEIN